MRPIEEVKLVLSLVESGLNDCEIERRTGIPRRTVLGWRHGKIPRRGPRGPRGTRRSPTESCPRCGHPRHDHTELPWRNYAYLLGLYLGDGSIFLMRRGVYVLRIFLDRRYPGIVQECLDAMASVMPASRPYVYARRGENTDEASSYSKAWPCLFPQHGPGKKHLRSIKLADWQQAIAEAEARALVRGLIHSDGCYSINTIKHPKRTYVYPRYLFSNRSDDIRKIFCEACDRLGIEWRVMNAFNISVARHESVALMDEFVGPKE